MKYKVEDFRSHFNEYFKIFCETAPKNMVDYVGNSGLPNAMASSLESCISFANQVKDENAIILNSGAGASSWVLRKIFKNVYCTDPDLEYLNAVKYCCEKGGLSTENFIMIPDGEKKLDLLVDYCYYDYGNIERMPYLEKHVNATKYLLYVDDTDKRKDCEEYRNFVYNKFNNYIIRDCPEAIDEYGRWGVFIIKK